MTQRVRRLGALLVLVALGSGSAPVRAQGTQSGQTAQVTNEDILKELKAIRQLLETLATKLTTPAPAAPSAPPAPPPDRRVHLAEVSGIVLGKADAPLTMVEFTDLQCPFCRRFHLEAFADIKREYIDTGRLRFVSRDLPIPSLHPLATAAARAAGCAADQNKWWEMRHAILAGNTQLRPESFAGFAEGLKLDMAAFTTCTADPTRHAEQLAKDGVDARNLGIAGTPTFIVGRTIPSGLDGVLVVGALPFAAFDAKFKELLGTVK
jgi:protein-disulfide isomerase